MQVDFAKAGATGQNPINELTFARAGLEFDLIDPPLRHGGRRMLVSRAEELLHPCASVVHSDDRPIRKRTFQLFKGDLVEFKVMRRVKETQIDLLIPDIGGAKFSLGFPYEMKVLKTLKAPVTGNLLGCIINIIAIKLAVPGRGLQKIEGTVPIMKAELDNYLGAENFCKSEEQQRLISLEGSRSSLFTIEGEVIDLIAGRRMQSVPYRGCCEPKTVITIKKVSNC